MGTNDVVRVFYDAAVETEWTRLERHPVEFEITSNYLRRYIRPGDRVLDLGGGPGRYSLMLAEWGCDVTLVDLSPNNIAFAQAIAASRSLSIKAHAADALDIETLVEGAFDHVLLMGPLYHLTTESQREQVVRACRNLLNEKGTIFASIITAHAGILYYLQHGPELIALDQENEYLEAIKRGESFTGHAFTQAHFMNVGHLIPFMEAQGFHTMHRINCEGVVSPREKDILALDEGVYKRWLELSLAVCEREEYVGLAEHALYVGRKG